MRVATLLLLVAVCRADDPLEPTLRAFQGVREDYYGENKTRILPVVDRMIESRDPRVVEPLTVLLADTLKAEEDLFRALREARTRGATATEEMQAIGKTLQHLRIRERSGAQLGPEIEKAEQEHRKRIRVISESDAEAEQIRTSVEFVRELREKLVLGSAAVAGALEGDAAPAAIATFRGKLDVADHEQALLLVRILRLMDGQVTAQSLVDILRDDKADSATILAAAAALARLRDRNGTAALLELAERDEPPGLRGQVLHLLGMAARKRFEKVAEAREWAATLE